MGWEMLYAYAYVAVREVAVAGFSVNHSTDPMGGILWAPGFSVDAVLKSLSRQY